MTDDEKNVFMVGLDLATKILDDDEIYDSLINEDGFSEDFVAGFQYAVELLYWIEEDIENGIMVEDDYEKTN